MNVSVLGVILGVLVAIPAFAETRKVYLVATVQLGGSNLAQSVFLHEPDVTDLAACGEAVRRGQRDRDWLKYRHIFRRDKFKGFTAQLSYRCVYSDLVISVWRDGPRYDQPYLVSIDEHATLRLRKATSQANCTTLLAALPAERRAGAFCAMSNQRVAS